MAVSFKTLMSTIDQVNDTLYKSHDIDKGREEARKLYKIGITMIQNAISGQLLFTDKNATILPAVDAIYDMMKLQYADNIPLQRTLSKVFCIFLELKSYQDIRKCYGIPVPTELRDKYYKLAVTLEECLAPDQESAEAKFMLRCAKEGTKRLIPSQAFWKKYVLDSTNILASVGDAATGSTSAIWDAVKKIITDINQDWGSGWYNDVHVYRWESLGIETIEEFDKKIVPIINKSINEGANYSNCLAMIFMRIIKTSQNGKVKMRALLGDDNNKVGLTDLINRESPHTWEDFWKHLPEKISSWFGKVDRFWETRQIALRYVTKLATKEKYKKEYGEICKEALLLRMKQLQSKEPLTLKKMPAIKKETHSQMAACETKEKKIDQEFSEQLHILKQNPDQIPVLTMDLARLRPPEPPELKSRFHFPEEESTNYEQKKAGINKQLSQQFNQLDPQKFKKVAMDLASLRPNGSSRAKFQDGITFVPQRTQSPQDDMLVFEPEETPENEQSKTIRDLTTEAINLEIKQHLQNTTTESEQLIKNEQSETILELVAKAKNLEAEKQKLQDILDRIKQVEDICTEKHKEEKLAIENIVKNLS